MDYLTSKRYGNVYRLLLHYIHSGRYDKYLALLHSLPPSTTSVHWNNNQLELAYALANTSKFLTPGSKLASNLLELFQQVLTNLSQNRLSFCSSADVNHYFQLTYHLVNAIISVSDKSLFQQYSSTADNLVKNLSFISNAFTDSDLEDGSKLIYYFILFGYVFAISQNSSFLIAFINKDPNFSANLKLFTYISNIIENQAFLNQLESIIANSLVISLNDSVPNDSTSNNYRLLYQFNLNFAKIAGYKPKTTEFCSLLFLKYLNLIRLNLILSISKVPLAKQGKKNSSVIESLVYLRSKELDLNDVQANETNEINGNATSSEEQLDGINGANSTMNDLESSISVSALSTTSTITYLNASSFSKNHLNLLLQISSQSLNQLLTFQNGASFIVLSSLSRINLIFQNKSLILEIFSLLYFLKLINFDFIYKNLLKKNLLINYTNSNNYNSLVDGTLNDAESTSANSFTSTGAVSADLVDNNELINPSLSFNIFGLLSLITMEESADNTSGGSYDSNLPALINKKISFLIFNNPSLSFKKVLQKSLHCIALAYRHCSQDNVVGLIYSLINLLSVDNDNEPAAPSSDLPVNINNGVMRSLTGTLRAPRLGSLKPHSNNNLEHEAKHKNVANLSANSTGSISTRSSVNNTASVLNTSPYDARNNGHAAAINHKNHHHQTPNDPSLKQVGGIFENSIKSIIELTNSYNQEEISVLVITILVQKFRIVNTSKSAAGIENGQSTSSSYNSERISELLNLLIAKNLYKLTYNLHDDKKNFQLLVKTYSNLLSYSVNSDSWRLAKELINAYCKIAKILRDYFYLISKDDDNSSRLKASYIILPTSLSDKDQMKSYSAVKSLYDSQNRLIYDLTNPKVNENYKIFLHELLNSIISKGDNLNKLEDNSHHRSHTEISEVAKKIEVYLKPLSKLLPSPFENQSSLIFNASQGQGKKDGVSNLSFKSQMIIDEVTVNLFRNIWFNMIIHGVNIDLLPSIIPLSGSVDIPKLNKKSNIRADAGTVVYYQKLVKYLRIIAYNTPPLASELSWSHNENLLELNTVLRRGSSHSNVRFQKSVIESIVNKSGKSEYGEHSFVSSLDTDTPTTFKGKISSTPKLMFLAAAAFLESLRVESGVFYKSLLYFSDPSIRLSNLEKDMKLITYELLVVYLANVNKNFNSVNQVTASEPAASEQGSKKALPAGEVELNLAVVNNFTISHISAQLSEMLILTCATNSVLQGIAIQCCDLLITGVPNVLSHQESFTLFKLLDLLNLLFFSIVNYQKLKYSPILEFHLPNYALNSVTNSHDITSFEKIILLDSLEWRQSTFEMLQMKAREWILLSLKNSNQVMKNLLQNYVVINSNISSTANNQLYSTIKHYKSDSSINFGVSFAIEMGKSILVADKEIHNIATSSYLNSFNNTRVDTLSELLINYNISADLSNVKAEYISDDIHKYARKLRERVSDLNKALTHDKKSHTGKNQFYSRHVNASKNNEIVSIIDAISSFLSIVNNSKQKIKDAAKYESEFTKYLIEIPFKVFNCDILKYCISHWLIISTNNLSLQFLIINEILKNFQDTVLNGKGLFNNHNSRATNFSPEYKAMEYAPSNKQESNHFASVASESFKIHLLLIRLIQSFFHSSLYQSNNMLRSFNDFTVFVLKNFSKISSHPFSRLLRFEIIKFSLDVLVVNLSIKNINVNDKILSLIGSSKNTKATESVFDYNLVNTLVYLILNASLDWFKYRKILPFGDNLLKIKTDYNMLIEVANLITNLNLTGDNNLVLKKKLLLMFLNDEINSIHIWLNPVSDFKTLTSSKMYDFGYNNKILSSDAMDSEFLYEAYKLDPSYAINIVSRITTSGAANSVKYRLVLKKILFADPLAAINYPEALNILLDPELYTNDMHLLTNETSSNSSNPLKYLLYWDSLSPIESINLFLPPFGKHPYVLQYAMKSLASHDINVTFFYVPQIVQMLRFDVEGYVQKFILETAQISQLFAHQIIWNMLANSYKDDEGTVPDELKPKLDEIRNLMTKSFSPDDFAYYEKEFSFFKEITGISGKLKPYIKKTKAEKKLKIDEEMRKIQVEPGVYLPSNPDGTLVDINRTSGKPLQSHAKAPFMATFKISRKIYYYDDDEDGSENIAVNVQETDGGAGGGPDSPAGGKESDPKSDMNSTTIETWQSAIFKVGDDCRQDVLALQLISVFRSIWANNNLDLYVFPYRVTATDAGCGIIDVLPNSVSRDMLGREAVNGLYEYFITKFGPEYSTEFQVARNNLIKSLAAYSIISYLLQFKDRHNGNIMYDDQGHILHIDFGFCFDIVPGGVKFEAVPFKLTKEMVMVMGGSNDTQSFKRFEELCVQGFLAVRPYMDVIVKCVLPMLESGLPCFKGMTTIRNLKSRFVPQKSEKEAALFMRRLIRKSYESFFTKGYDEFQRLTNGIPY